MADVKYYNKNIGVGRNLYCIDSNILINVGKLYFDGKCGCDDILTDQIRKFIILCRNTGMLIYDYALLEISFDFGTNGINADIMNKFMMVIDTLFMNCSDEEVINHIPQFKPYCKEKLSGDFDSIFDCKLPQIAFSDELGSLKIFYLMYLYMIIIFYLSTCNIKPMEKVKRLYNYMTKEINCFMAHEFQLGQMIFIGSQKDKNIAEGIMKFGKIRKGKGAILVLINALLDIMSYRRITTLVDLSLQIKEPTNCSFVTQDKELQNYIELNSDFKTVINGDKITDTFSSEFVPDKKYLIEWKEFYYHTVIVNAKHRFMEYQLGKKPEVNYEKILREINYYENMIFRH